MEKKFAFLFFDFDCRKSYCDSDKETCTLIGNKIIDFIRKMLIMISLALCIIDALLCIFYIWVCLCMLCLWENKLGVWISMKTSITLILIFRSKKKERKKAEENKTTATATATNKWNGPDGGTKTNCGKFLFSIEIISESIYVHSMP